jgi:hypothetical protein
VLVKRSVATVLIVAACAGCSGGGDKAKRDDGSPGQWTEAVLVIAPAALTVDNGSTRHLLRLDADGSVFADDKLLATVSTKGELTIDGKLAAILLSDGTVTIPDEGDEAIKIRDDGALIDGVDPKKVLLEFGADGTLRGPLLDGELKGTTMTSSGSPKARRALMLAWLGALSIIQVGDQPPPMD